MSLPGYRAGEDCDISPMASISEGAVLGNRVRIGPGAVIGDGVVVDDNCSIGPGVILGEPTRGYYHSPDEYRPSPTSIGAGSIIRAHTCIYAGVTIGEKFECGPFVSIRENTVIGPHSSMGSYGDIQGECIIGEGCRFHSSVHIAQHSVIGDHVWIFPYVLMLNAPIAPLPPEMELKGPTIGDYSVILARALLMAGVTLGEHAVVAAGSRVSKDVADWDMVAGDPARMVCDSRKFIFPHQGKIYKPYPWMKHRREGYPWQDQIPGGWDE